MLDVAKSLKYNYYDIFYDKESNSIKCFTLGLKSLDEINQSPEEAYNSIHNLIYDTLKNLPKDIEFTISPELEKAIINKQEYKKETIFTNIDTIMQIPAIKNIWLNWFYQNGIPNVVYQNTYGLIDGDKKLKDEIYYEKLFREESKKYKYYNYNRSNLSSINFAINSRKYLKSKYPFLTWQEKNQTNYARPLFAVIDLSPLINLAFVSFFLNYFRNKFKNGKYKNLSEMLYIFPHLLEIYNSQFKRERTYEILTPNQKEKNQVILKFIKKYFITLSCYTLISINKYDIARNYDENIFSNLSILEDEEYNNSFSFLQTRHVINNMFLAAFEFIYILCQSNGKLEEHKCDECGHRMLRRQHLCYNCKIKEYEERLNKYENPELKNEYEKLLKNKNAYTPLIEKLYIDKTRKKEKEKRK